MNDLDTPEWLILARQRIKEASPVGLVLVCKDWDILELYNSGLTYRVLAEYDDPHPLVGNYRYDIWKSKVYVVELPCVWLSEEETRDG